MCLFSLGMLLVTLENHQQNQLFLLKKLSIRRWRAWYFHFLFFLLFFFSIEPPFMKGGKRLISYI